MSDHTELIEEARVMQREVEVAMTTRNGHAGSNIIGRLADALEAATAPAPTEDERAARALDFWRELFSSTRKELDHVMMRLAAVTTNDVLRRQAPQVTRDEVEALIQRVDDEENWSNIFSEEGRQIADALLAEFDITRKARE